MNSAVAAQIESLETMTVGQLVKKYEAVIEEECRSRNKRYLCDPNTRIDPIPHAIDPFPHNVLESHCDSFFLH